MRTVFRKTLSWDNDELYGNWGIHLGRNTWVVLGTKGLKLLFKCWEENKRLSSCSVNVWWFFFLTKLGSCLVRGGRMWSYNWKLGNNAYTQGKGKSRLPAILPIVSGNVCDICWLWSAWFLQLDFSLALVSVHNCITPGVASRTYDMSEIRYRTAFKKLFWQGPLLGWKEKGHARKKVKRFLENKQLICHYVCKLCLIITLDNP